MIQITSEELYKTAFFYAVGIISTFPYYEEIHSEEIADHLIQRAFDLLEGKNVQS